ncbi:MAG: response regulator [Brachybacterium sp.]
MIRIVLADDDSLLRSSLSILLSAEADMDVVAAVEDGARAVAAARALAPDVLLLDVRMPGMDGIQASRALREDPPPTPPSIVMMTMFDEEDHLQDALATGVDGYLLKDSRPQQLLEAIRAAARGERVLGTGPLDRVIGGYLRTADPDPGHGGDPALSGLTPREREVLELIARGRSNAEIQDELFISRGTLKAHISALLRKTSSRDRAALIVLALRNRP